MIKISLTKRIGDGTNNINVLIDNPQHMHIDTRLVAWLSAADVWNMNADPLYSPKETEMKFELPATMEAFLYSASFKHFVMKFHNRRDIDFIM